MHSMESERLVLRRLQENDVAPLMEMLASPPVMRWLFPGKPMTAHDARTFIDKNVTFGQSATGIGILHEKETDRFVGFAGLLPCRYLDADDFEIGAGFVNYSWYKGYGVEDGLTQITYGLEVLKLERLRALAYPDNVNSLKVLDKLGMTVVKEISTGERGPRRVYLINHVRGGEGK